MGILSFLLLVVIVVLIIQLINANKKLVPFKAITDLEGEIEKRRQQVDLLKQAHIAEQAIVDELRTVLADLRVEETLLDVGFYQAKFAFETSAQYQARLESVRATQKDLIASGNAVTTSTKWTVQGSEKKGEQITNRIIKLALRAFNGECDAIVAKVKFGNVDTSRTRIEKTRDAINKLGETWGIAITDQYLASVIDELHLVYEYQEKLNEEREEQRRIKEEMREEERARREYEKAQEDAEREERRYSDALEKARKEMEGKLGAEQDAYQSKIRDLERLLQEAHMKKERAISQAQLTRSGHVYVISNIGSFGEDVYKIGMTRRLEPLDRIKELGDASVPFTFDVHAIIYSEDAPGVENRLHKQFDLFRVNLVNEKREFFRVTLDQIEAAVRQIEGFASIEFTKVAVAKEYRETLGLRETVKRS